MQPAPLSLTARTLYAELLELALAVGLSDPIARLPGSVVEKRIRTRTYLYFQYRDLDGRTRQAYLGPDDPHTRLRVEQVRARAKDADADQAQLDALRAAYLAAGGHAVEHAPLRVMAAFADAGVLRPGPGTAVLVGTHAFNAIGNLLGVRWSGQMQTQDIDLAAPELLAADRIALALPPDLPAATDVLSRLNMGFIPVPTLDPRTASTSYRIRGKDLRVDLLTPLTGKPASTPRMVGLLKAPAQPLRFLDYLIEAPITAVVAGRRRAVVLNVPAPERFALHKLLLSAVRPSAFATKAQKDRIQATQLLGVLIDEAPDGLETAYAELAARGAGWVRKVAQAVGRCAEQHPQLVANLEELLGPSFRS